MDERKQKRKESELTPKQHAYVEALASGKGLEAAAVAAGISDRTGRLWRALPSVQAALRAARSERLADATSVSVAMMGDALETLRAVMQDTEAPYSARVAAARCVLESGVKFTEVLDLAARVAELEAINERANPPRQYPS